MEANATALQEWEVEQLLKLRERQPDLIEPALRRLVEENDEIHWSVVVGAYQDRQINLGKAAELLHMTELELRDRFIELGIPLRMGLQTSLRHVPRSRQCAPGLTMRRTRAVRDRTFGLRHATFR